MKFSALQNYIIYKLPWVSLLFSGWGTEKGLQLEISNGTTIMDIDNQTDGYSTQMWSQNAEIHGRSEVAKWEV